MCSYFSFLDLPWEIRCLVYQYTFAGAQLSVEQEQHQPKHAPVVHIYRNASFRPGLLSLCKQIGTEAFPVLANQTSLLLLPGLQDPDEAIDAIPPAWLARIPTVLNTARIRSRITHVLRQRHIDPARFPNLRLYRVAHLIYPDWRDTCHRPEDFESFVQSHVEADFFFQAGTLRLFSQTRTYALTITLWLLRAYVEESDGWEVEFSLDSWTVLHKRKARFRRHKATYIALWDDPKCRDYRGYDVELLKE